jgi:hypothetical protein
VILRKISGSRLRAFLLRYEGFLRRREIELPPETEPPDGERPYDYTALSRAISRPDWDSPSELVDTLHVINDMCGESAHDAMCEAIETLQLQIDLPDDATTAEIALAIWMVDPRILSDLHIQQLYTAQRRFEFFKVQVAPIPPFVSPTNQEMEEMCRSLNALLKKTRRGEGSRMFVHNESSERIVRILVQHGQTCKREGNYINNQSESLLYRPETFDTIHFSRDTGEIAINCESRKILKGYLRIFGRHIFQDESVFKEANKYTLAPLYRDQDASLNVDGICGGRISQIILREVTIRWNRQRKDFEIRKSINLFESMRQRNRQFQEPRNGSGEFIQAKFDIYFSGNPKPRKLTIAPPREARYERDEDGALIEEWMNERGFILQENGGDDGTQPVDVARNGSGRTSRDLETAARA